MKEAYVFIENGEIKSVFDNFVKFRKTSFHYILGFLVNHNFFSSKLEGGKKLKQDFTKFYAKNSEKLVYKNFSWECKKFVLNDLEEELVESNSNKENEKKEVYETKYTKISVLKGTNNFKSLNQKLAYVKLSPLYGR